MHFSVYLFHAKFFFPWLIKRVCEVTRSLMTLNYYVLSLVSWESFLFACLGWWLSKLVESRILFFYWQSWCFGDVCKSFWRRLFICFTLNLNIFEILWADDNGFSSIMILLQYSTTLYWMNKKTTQKFHNNKKALHCGILAKKNYLILFLNSFWQTKYLIIHERSIRNIRYNDKGKFIWRPKQL